ncbi:MAG: hypothetical protein D6736_17360 [Nitrospinota bacterium]|nr:MAG: hypothetical protein D6736_17360 [Nitrospinota bacterium]
MLSLARGNLYILSMTKARGLEEEGSLMRTLITALLVLSLAVSVHAAATNGSELLPPGAKPGECYARVFVPATYKTETEKVLVKEASEKIEVIPAQYEWVEEKVLVQPASFKLEVVPAEFEEVEEKIIDQPAHTVWKKGRGLIERLDFATGEIMCLVNVPATYKTIKKQVLKKPATTRKVEIPAKYITIKKQVVKEPAKIRKIPVPAEYKTVKVRKLISPPQEKRIPVPAEYQTITKKIKVSEGRMEWRPVLCETNVTPKVVKSIQEALQKAGFDPGQIDGVLGRATMAAVESFQKAKGLPVGSLTIETLNLLGVKLQ